MRRKCGIKNLVFGCVVGAAVAATLGLLHYSFSTRFVGGEPITVRGYLTRVEWTSPHAYFYLDVEDDDGTRSSWAFEMGSPIVLQSRGWTPRSLNIGEELEVEGFLARDGAPLVNASSVLILATGERLEAAMVASAAN